MGDEKGTIYHISKVPIRDYLINWDGLGHLGKHCPRVFV